ncbi:ABC transporter ATP-binding protein [Bacillus shivajii]|uniref:ABC transporter ATP-binding protein n=1 Tax=Bacillus shivajii TaxID=1983719 RepID=UPI001CF9B426|nr:ABC transporter ATP-binding protein [Bacillus shivajii]UCZ54396.1 ABC transporter ATP-binding protein [Bacillus shivajii]
MEGSMMTLQDVVRSYRRFTLGPITLQIPKGLLIALIGRNGAGKTTLLQGMSGINVFDQGDVQFEQESIDFLDPKIRTKMTYINNEIQMYSDYTVEQSIHFVSSFYSNWDNEWVNYWLNVFQIHRLNEIHELSKGMKMKLNLILGLAHKPSLVLLDEPTDGLDSISRQQFFDLLQAYIEDGDKTVILSTHYTKDVEGICDYVLFLKNGNLSLKGEVEKLKEEFTFFSLPPTTNEQNLSESAIVVKSDVELKGILPSSECDDLPNEAVMRPPSLDDLFFFVVEKGGNPIEGSH